MNSRRNTIVSAVAALGLLGLTACGGDDSSSSSDAASIDTVTNDSLFTGAGDGSDFCNLARQFSEATNGMDPSDPAQFKKGMQDMGGVIDKLADIAPDDIKDDMKGAAESIHSLLDVLEKYDYDMVALAANEEDMATATAAMDSNPSMEAVDAYMADTCDIAG